jgi:hypothetical protein
MEWTIYACFYDTSMGHRRKTVGEESFAVFEWALEYSAALPALL